MHTLIVIAGGFLLLGLCLLAGHSSVSVELLRTGCTTLHPLLELGDELGVRNGHRTSAQAGIPAPKHELVMAHVLEKRFEVLVAVGLGVLDRPTEIAARPADEDHLRLRRWQVPVRSSGRDVGSV